MAKCLGFSFSFWTTTPNGILSGTVSLFKRVTLMTSCETQVQNSKRPIGSIARSKGWSSFTPCTTVIILPPVTSARLIDCALPSIYNSKNLVMNHNTIIYSNPIQKLLYGIKIDSLDSLESLNR
jgi:hypothetical protein